MDSSRLRRRLVEVSRMRVLNGPAPVAAASSRAASTSRTAGSGGKPWEPNQSQMERSSAPGRSTTSARSTPRPARPTCW